MKNTFKYTVVALGALLSLSSCTLDYVPVSQPSEPASGSEGSDSVKYATKAEMKAVYDNMYEAIRGDQEGGYLDLLTNTDTHADNSYCGTTGAEITSIEQQTQQSSNKNITRDWNNYLGKVTVANQIICNIDAVPDNTLSAAERTSWKAEAMVYRAWSLYYLTLLWGDVPVVTTEPPTITSENIEEVYPLLYPARKPADSVFKQIVEDLEFALEHAPDVDPSNKAVLSKGVAAALLAKTYAEKSYLRDYSKTIEYADMVERMGYSLVDNYATLFSINEAGDDFGGRNTSESIFESIYTAASGNWVWMMFYINELAPQPLDWAKWCTPSRDLINAFDREGDRVRKDQSIVITEAPWSNYYPSSSYAFMYKTRSNANSIIKIRLADIILLRAEAKVALGDLSGAAQDVNRIRARVGLEELEASITGDAHAMKHAVLNERRLELAFEGQRWFDLVRNTTDSDPVIYDVMNSLNSRDSGRLPMSTLTQDYLVYPIPQTEIDKNPNLEQNPGY